MFSSFDLQYGFQGSLGISIRNLFCTLLVSQSQYPLFSHSMVLLWAIQVQQIRFFIPAVAVVVIYGIVKIPRNNLWMLLLCLSSVDISHMLVWKRQQGFDYWIQHVDDRDFLRTQLLENYPIDEYINALETRQKIWYVWMRGYTYYSQKEIRVDSVFGGLEI